MYEDTQLPFGKDELCETTVQADKHLGEDPHNRLIHSIKAWEMSGDFTVEIALVF